LPPTPYSGLVFGATPARPEGAEGAADDTGMADASDADATADDDFDIKPVKRN